MIRRRSSLQQVLRELEEGTLDAVSTIVVSRRWWDALPVDVQTDYHKRCVQRGIALRADDGMSRHFGEVIDHPGETPLSSERHV